MSSVNSRSSDGGDFKQEQEQIRVISRPYNFARKGFDGVFEPYSSVR